MHTDTFTKKCTPMCRLYLPFINWVRLIFTKLDKILHHVLFCHFLRLQCLVEMMAGAAFTYVFLSLVFYFYVKRIAFPLVMK